MIYTHQPGVVNKANIHLGSRVVKHKVSTVVNPHPLKLYLNSSFRGNMTELLRSVRPDVISAVPTKGAFSPTPENSSYANTGLLF